MQCLDFALTITCRNSWISAGIFSHQVTRLLLPPSSLWWLDCLKQRRGLIHLINAPSFYRRFQLASRASYSSYRHFAQHKHRPINNLMLRLCMCSDASAVSRAQEQQPDYAGAEQSRSLINVKKTVNPGRSLKPCKRKEFAGARISPKKKKKLLKGPECHVLLLRLTLSQVNSLPDPHHCLPKLLQQLLFGKNTKPTYRKKEIAGQHIVSHVFQQQMHSSSNDLATTHTYIWLVCKEAVPNCSLHHHHP